MVTNEFKGVQRGAKGCKGVQKSAFEVLGCIHLLNTRKYCDNTHKYCGSTHEY